MDRHFYPLIDNRSGSEVHFGTISGYFLSYTSIILFTHQHDTFVQRQVIRYGLLHYKNHNLMQGVKHPASDA